MNELTVSAPDRAFWLGPSQLRGARVRSAQLSLPLLTALLFWPLLTLIARQTVYFSGQPIVLTPFSTALLEGLAFFSISITRFLQRLLPWVGRESGSV